MPVPQKKKPKSQQQKKKAQAKKQQQQQQQQHSNPNNQPNKNASKDKPKQQQQQQQKSSTTSKKKAEEKNNDMIDEKKSDEQQQQQQSNGNRYSIRGVQVITPEEYRKKGQTLPPSKRVSTLFESDAHFPTGEILLHPVDGKLRMESDERKAREKHVEWQTRISSVREGGEIHRQIRQAAQQYIQPGMTMTHICEYIEQSTLKLTGYDPEKPIDRGYGFPTGCSLNHCAAHYTPNPGDKIVLQKSDLCKIDFGVQINGYIIDCAFSMTFDEMHDPLMEAVKAATNEGIRVMGIDARLGEIGASIQEVMQSHECTYNGKTYKVKPIENLNGHSIGRWIIHGGKTVPIVKTDETTKMEEGELYAIETFGSTGKGRVYSDGECSHFALMSDAPKVTMEHKGARDLLKFIKRRFGTIPFCRRWLQDEGQTRHLMGLKKLVEYEIVRDYPPLCDQVGCYTAQYEHTILLRPTCKEVVSRGYDY